MKFLVLFWFFNAAHVHAMEVRTLEFSNGVRLKVEVAQNFVERQKGLMYRTSLAADEGMLFVFDRPQHLSFWMKDTYIPLSIAYFDKNKKLKEIHKMKAQSMMERHQDLKHYPSDCECQYAIEVNQGWFSKKKIKKGMSFKFLSSQKKSQTAKQDKDLK